MSRIVIEVHPNPEGDGFEVVLAEPEHIKGGWEARAFPCTPGDSVAADFIAGRKTVTDMGAHLVGGLRSHPAIHQALNELRSANPAESPRPLYVRVTAESEGLPWETLCDESAFLALDPRWPVARMGREGGRRTPTVDFEPPLRVMVVLGAARVSALDEWASLQDALQRARFPVSVMALVAEDVVRAEAEKASAGTLSVKVVNVPPDREILDVIADFRPHVLHFFGHGVSSSGFSFIQIATKASWPNLTGHVVLEPTDLATKSVLDATWIVTLNLCRGAQPGGAGSFAYSLLTRGFPVVVAMREPTSAPDAHTFSRAFYRSLMPLLEQPVAGGAEVDLDLAATMYEPRRRICAQHGNGVPCSEAAGTSREWTLPVLYVRAGGLAVRRREPAQPVAAVGSGPRRRGGEQDELEPERASILAYQRASKEVKRTILKDLILNPVPGTHPNALRAYQAEVARLETDLFGVASDVVQEIAHATP